MARYGSAKPTKPVRFRYSPPMSVDYADVVMFGDGVSCPAPGCTYHVRHPCEMCGRKRAQGVAEVRMGFLIVRQEVVIEENERRVIP